MQSKSAVIKDICHALSTGLAEDAAEIARHNYPHVAVSRSSRTLTELDATKIFVRDGFVDRYTGERLIFPGTLRLLSLLLPSEFPYHKNWKMAECHLMYWELFPTIDHRVPVARDGANIESNCVTTTMLRNAAKANWTLEELGWQLFPPGDIKEWDGLIAWYLSYLDTNPTIRDNYLDRWYRAAQDALRRGLS